MNITLSASEDVVQDVRQWAISHNSSLNQFIRETLESKAKEIRKEREAKAGELSVLLDSLDLRVPPDWKFDRNEANRRGK